MKNLVSKVWNWLKSVFTSDETKSELTKVIVGNLSSDELSIIRDKTLSDKAIEYVKELNKRDDLDNEQKAKEFNKYIAEQAKSLGKVLGKAAINLLRELAVVAVKILIAKAKAGLI